MRERAKSWLVVVGPVGLVVLFVVLAGATDGASEEGIHSPGTYYITHVEPEEVIGDPDVYFAFDDPNLGAFVAWALSMSSTFPTGNDGFSVPFPWPAVEDTLVSIEIFATVPRLLPMPPAKGSELLPMPPAAAGEPAGIWVDMHAVVGAIEAGRTEEAGGGPVDFRTTGSSPNEPASVSWRLVEVETFTTPIPPGMSTTVPAGNDSLVVRYHVAAICGGCGMDPDMAAGEETVDVRWGATMSTTVPAGDDSLVDYGDDQTSFQALPDLAAVVWLDVAQMGIGDLGGIERCINLVDLNLGKNEISDVTPLAELPKLVRLNLSGNRVSDLSGIEACVDLRSLKLSKNRISDLTPLAGLTRLVSLDLDKNRITDLGPLAGLSASYVHRDYIWPKEIGLRILNVSGNQIEDLTPLGNFPNLWNLDVSDNRIEDLSPIASLVRIEGLQENRTEDPTEAQLVGLDQEEAKGLSASVVVIGRNPLDLEEGSETVDVIELMKSFDVKIELEADMPHV